MTSALIFQQIGLALLGLFPLIIMLLATSITPASHTRRRFVRRVFVGVFVGVVVAYFVASALLRASALLLASADSANAVAAPVGLGSASSFAVLG